MLSRAELKAFLQPEFRGKDLITYSLKHAFEFRQLCEVKQSIAYFYTRLKASINKANRINFINAWDKRKEKKTFASTRKSLHRNSLAPPRTFPFTLRFLERERTEKGLGF